MKKKYGVTGGMLVVMFVVWTLMIQMIDVQNIGQVGTAVGFATLNAWFHEVMGVHLEIYTLTDWLGLIPMFVCLLFAGIGFIQLIKRKSLLKVDKDILLLGCYYVFVIGGYLIFEMCPVNYRPILIEGRMEASYPSSTTLLVLSVMPTLVFQIKRRVKSAKFKKWVCFLSILFSAFMVIARLISGVHWFTDIVGALLLSAGLFYLYKAAVLMVDKDLI